MNRIVLVGILDGVGNLDLHVPFVGEFPATAESRGTGDNMVAVSLTDRNGAILEQATLDAWPVCGSGHGTMAYRQIVGSVGFPADTAGVRIFWRNRMIYEKYAHASPPFISLNWSPPSNGIVIDSQHVSWDVIYSGSEPLHFLVLVESRTGEREAIASIRGCAGRHSIITRLESSFHCPPTNAVRLVVICSDGFHQSIATSEYFSVSPNE